MSRTHLILDGLDDPLRGQQLSVRWSQAGFDNAVDVAGQSAWLSRKSGHADSQAPLTETEVDRAADIARGFGLEPRDRVGETFVADNSLDALRQRMAYEYKSRLATALVFGLPGLVLHYFGGYLAGAATEPRDMLYPWLLQLLLVGWACLAAGWPILWQGVLSLIHLRSTSDLLVSLTLLAAAAPSAIGLSAILFGAQPFFDLAGPTFHAAVYLLCLATAQRWLAYRRIEALAGKAMLMPRRFNRLAAAWLALSAVVMIVGGWRTGLAMAMLLPPLAALGAINPWNPGWSALLPTFAFAGLMLLDPVVGDATLAGVRIEVAAGFGLLQTLVMHLGWRKIGIHRTKL